ncbi:MAG: thioesterase family protein [Ilumatobacteraceae bacterium]
MIAPADATFFVAGPDHWFEPTPYARGPWSADACHAGPPAALMARASEQAIPHQRLTRIHVDLDRPVPMAGFRITTQVLRSGRTTSTATITLTGADQRVVARALTLHVAERPVLAAALGDRFKPPPLPAHDGRFPIAAIGHTLTSFLDACELRYPPEHPPPGPGDEGVFWMRTIALLPGEAMSPFQRLCPIADCTNAFSRHLDDEVAYMNVDLTVAAHRDPIGHWVGSHARSTWAPHGVASTTATLFDTTGAVGAAAQILVLAPR